MSARWRAAIARVADRPLLAIAIAIATVAATARLASLAIFGVRLGADSYYYLGTAERLLDVGPSAVAHIDLVSAPLYPLSIAVAASVLHLDSIAAAMALQVLAGALTAVLVVRITDRVGRSLVPSAIAGVIAAVDPSFLFWGDYVLSETLFLLAVAFAVDRAMALIRSSRPILDGFVAGIALLVALAARSTALAFAFAIVVALVITFRGDPRRMVEAAAGGALALASVIVAFTVSAGSLPGAAHVDRVVRYVWSAVYMGLEWTEQGRATNGVDLTGGPVDGDHRRAVIEWVSADPMHFFLQMFRKLRTFWSPVLPEFSYRHAALNLAWYVPLYATTLNGLRSIGLRTAEVVVLVLGIAGFTLQAMITFVDYDQRFRLPAELLLIPLASLGARPLYEAVERAWRRRPASERRQAAAGVTEE
ncbi:MAG: hypothetical protein HY553_05910 [Elusimicrobia bacterium]|nr:hypothetical protein [Elusimicrobiota bacterium]